MTERAADVVADVVADVIVVGTGNAGFCAAHAAVGAGARVLMLEKGPETAVGGNSYFTAGAIRTTFDSIDDLAALIDEPDARMRATEIPPYRAADFRDDMRRVTLGRCDPGLTEAVTEGIAGALHWLHGLGLRFRLQYERQAYEVDGRWRFWGGLPLATVDGGKGLVADHLKVARRTGIEIRYDVAVDRVLTAQDGTVTGVAAGEREFHAGAVVLAAGGFEADARRRAQFLGPGWDLAKVRGTPFNTGDALMAALSAGARPAGHWSGCHSVAWDAHAPATGDYELTNRYTKQSYPIGLVVNSAGERFVDEGADLRNYTYAKYGAAILREPGALAFQIYDARTAPLLRPEEYEVPGVSRYDGATIEELAERAGIDADGLAKTIAAYNDATRDSGEFDPTVKDGLSTDGLDLPKSNWAQPFDRAPFVGFAVTCGITFTFGGLAIDDHGRVLADDDRTLDGLFAAGENVGGLFFHNYPGGSGLAAGIVFGRAAGQSAAAYAAHRVAAPVAG